MVVRLEQILLRRVRQDSFREIRQAPALRFDELLEEFLDLFVAGTHRRPNIAPKEKGPARGPSSSPSRKRTYIFFFLVSVEVVIVEVVVVEGAPIVEVVVVVSVPVIAVPVVAVSVVVEVVAVAVVPVS